MKQPEMAAVLDVPPIGIPGWGLGDVQKILAEALPLGGRAIVVTEGGENGHAFNAVNTDEGVVLMDAGTGTTFQTQDEIAAFQKNVEGAPGHGDIGQINVYVTTSAAELPDTPIRRLILEWRENQRQAPSASHAAALDL